MPELFDLLKRAFAQLIKDVQSLHGLHKLSNENEEKIVKQLEVLNQHADKCERYLLVLAENIPDVIGKLDAIRAYTGAVESTVKHEILMEKIKRNHESE